MVVIVKVKTQWVLMIGMTYRLVGLQLITTLIILHGHSVHLLFGLMTSRGYGPSSLGGFVEGKNLYHYWYFIKR